MDSGFLAEVVLVIHGLFIAWAALGAIAVWRWPRLAILHLPALAWAIWIETVGGVCPLTVLENRLRRAAGQAGYSGGCITHYLGPIIYPAGLTREGQWMVAAVLALFNTVLYGLMIKRSRTRRQG